MWGLNTHPHPDDGDPWEGYAPFIPAKIFPVSIRPGVGEIYKIVGRENEFQTWEEVYALDVEDVAIRLMEEQRNMRFSQGGHLEDRHVVGGFCELTMVTRKETTKRIIKRWPDKVGDWIRPGC